MARGRHAINGGDDLELTRIRAIIHTADILNIWAIINKKIWLIRHSDLSKRFLGRDKIIIDNIVEASLGYFINPLVSVLLGMVFLGERLNRWQFAAIVIAAFGIAFQLISYGSVPWIALALAFSFGLYGLVRKRMNVHAIGGLCIETLILLPPALGCLAILANNGDLRFIHSSITVDLLLVAAGLVTSFPLLCFNAAVTRISLTAMGMFQYLAPSMTLVIAVLVYGEPFGIDRLITFTCIWIGIVIFTLDAIRAVRRQSMV